MLLMIFHYFLHFMKNWTRMNKKYKIRGFYRAFYHAIEFDMFPSLFILAITVMLFACHISQLILIFVAFSGYICLIVAYYLEEGEEKTKNSYIYLTNNRTQIDGATKSLKFVGRTTVFIASTLILILDAITEYIGLLK